MPQTLHLVLVHTTKAAIAPGTHPQMVNTVTNNSVPHPLSITASGGRIMHNMALPHPIRTPHFYIFNKN